MTGALLLAALLAAQNQNRVQERMYVLHPEDYCNVDGRKPSLPACPQAGTGDWSPIFSAMLNDPRCSPTTGTGNAIRIGCRVELQCNFDYQFASTLELCRGHEIRGCGVGPNWASTILSFNSGVATGVAMRSYSQCSTNPLQNNGGGMRLDGLMVRYDGAQNATSVGIDIAALASLKDVVVQNFGNGIWVHAASPANANLTYFESVHVRSLGGWGVYYEGADANAFVAHQLDIGSVCRLAPKWQQYDVGDPLRTPPPCWGVRVRSFLDGYLVGTHVADIRDNGLITEPFTGVTVSGANVTFSGLRNGHSLTRGFTICSGASVGTGWNASSDFLCSPSNTAGLLTTRRTITATSANSATITGYTGSGVTDPTATGNLYAGTSWYPSYISGESPSQSVMWYGAYEEDYPVTTGGALSEFDNNSMIWGGNVNNRLTSYDATQFQAGRMRGTLLVENADGPTLTTLSLGEAINDSWYDLRQSDNATRWFMGYETTYDTVKFCTLASPNACPQRWTTSQLTPYRPTGRYWISDDYILGPVGGPGAQIRVEFGGATTPDPTAYPVGSRYKVLVPAATSGTPVEYVLLCVGGTASAGDCSGGTKTWTVVQAVP